VLDVAQLNRLRLLSSQMSRVLSCDEPSKGKGLIVFSGCGTSGRVGYALAGKLNRFQRLRRGKDYDSFAYLMAGGPDAIISPRENVEDSARAGIDDLVNLVKLHAPTRVLLVGITCGLSATYVGAQLDAIQSFLDLQPGEPEDGLLLAGLECQFDCALLGFNPLSLV